MRLSGDEQVGLSAETRALADGSFHLPAVGFTRYVNVSIAVAMGAMAIDRRLRGAGLRRSLSAAGKAELRPAWYAALASTPARRREFLRTSATHRLRSTERGYV